MPGGGFSPIDGAANTMNAPMAAGAGGMPGMMPGGMSLGKAARKGHRKHGHKLHKGAGRHRAKKRAGHAVSKRKGY